MSVEGSRRLAAVAIPTADGRVPETGTVQKHVHDAGLQLRRGIEQKFDEEFRESEGDRYPNKVGASRVYTTAEQPASLVVEFANDRHVSGPLVVSPNGQTVDELAEWNRCLPAGKEGRDAIEALVDRFEMGGNEVNRLSTLIRSWGALLDKEFGYTPEDLPELQILIPADNPEIHSHFQQLAQETGVRVQIIQCNSLTSRAGIHFKVAEGETLMANQQHPPVEDVMAAIREAAGLGLKDTDILLLPLPIDRNVLKETQQVCKASASYLFTSSARPLLPELAANGDHFNGNQAELERAVRDCPEYEGLSETPFPQVMTTEGTIDREALQTAATSIFKVWGNTKGKPGETKRLATIGRRHTSVVYLHNEEIVVVEAAQIAKPLLEFGVQFTKYAGAHIDPELEDSFDLEIDNSTGGGDSGAAAEGFDIGMVDLNKLFNTCLNDANVRLFREPGVQFDKAEQQPLLSKQYGNPEIRELASLLFPATWGSLCAQITRHSKQPNLSAVPNNVKVSLMKMVAASCLHSALQIHYNGGMDSNDPTAATSHRFSGGTAVWKPSAILGKQEDGEAASPTASDTGASVHLQKSA